MEEARSHSRRERREPSFLYLCDCGIIDDEMKMLVRIVLFHDQKRCSRR